MNNWNELDPWVFYTVAFVTTLISLKLALKLIVTRKQISEEESPTKTALSELNEDRKDENVVRNIGSETAEQPAIEDATLKPDTDPVLYVEHIQSEVKRAQHRVANKEIIKDMSSEQIVEEESIRADQLASIYKLMMEQQDKFGINSMDDIQQQLKLYS